MTKEIKAMMLTYKYDANRTNSHYTLDGVKYMNHGDLMELAAKAAYGLEPKKDGNTRYDKGDDIPEFHASVKSSNASVFNCKLGEDFDSSLDVYVTTVFSKEFWYIIDAEDEIHIYKMDLNEFKEFLIQFGKYNERSIIRLPKTTIKMVNWLEEKLQKMGKAI